MKGCSCRRRRQAPATWQRPATHSGFAERPSQEVSEKGAGSAPFSVSFAGHAPSGEWDQPLSRAPSDSEGGHSSAHPCPKEGRFGASASFFPANRTFSGATDRARTGAEATLERVPPELRSPSQTRWPPSESQMRRPRTRPRMASKPLSTTIAFGRRSAERDRRQPDERHQAENAERKERAAVEHERQGQTDSAGHRRHRH
jgi:hypothetical protein